MSKYTEQLKEILTSGKSTGQIIILLTKLRQARERDKNKELKKKSYELE